jgi:phage FluMu protein Com
MSFNVQFNSAVAYKPCTKCNKGLAKTDSTLCKDCRPKKESNRTLNKNLSKIYLHKFNTNNSLNRKELHKVANVSGI